MFLKSALIALCFILFYAMRIGFPTYPYFDEYHYVPAANGIAQLTAYTETSHPPLGKLLMASSIRAFGDVPWAWRLPSLILGGIATALAGYLAFLLTGSQIVFWLTSLLLSLDGLWITQARAGLLNTPMAFFILLTLVLWRHGHTTLSQRRHFWIAASICAGLAAACKWQGALVALIPPVFYVFCGKDERLTGPFKPHWMIYLLLAMAGAYFATFLIIPFIHGMTWSDIWGLQVRIPEYHLQHEQNTYFRYHSAWYTWPFLIRPVWFGFLRETPTLPLQNQYIDGILCVGNPLIFLILTPAMVWLAMQWYRRRSALATLALSGFLIFWIPSGLVTRYTFFTHFYAPFLFAVLGIAALLEHLWNIKNNAGPATAFGLVMAIILCYVFFYPLWVGTPISDPYYRLHLWMPWWI